jgi:hypothetical protein
LYGLAYLLALVKQKIINNGNGQKN